MRKSICRTYLPAGFLNVTWFVVICPVGNTVWLLLCLAFAFIGHKDARHNRVADNILAGQVDDADSLDIVEA